MIRDCNWRLVSFDIDIRDEKWILQFKMALKEYKETLLRRQKQATRLFSYVLSLPPSLPPSLPT